MYNGGHKLPFNKWSSRRRHFLCRFIIIVIIVCSCELQRFANFCWRDLPSFFSTLRQLQGSSVDHFQLFTGLSFHPAAWSGCVLITCVVQSKPELFDCQQIEQRAPSPFTSPLNFYLDSSLMVVKIIKTLNIIVCIPDCLSREDVEALHSSDIL